MAKKRLLDDSERMIPDMHNRTIMYAEHMTRYTAALDIIHGKTVLDIASGSGYGTKMLSASARKVYGVDVSQDAVEYAQENYGAKNIEYLTGNAEAIPLPDNSVDVVVTFETLEHVKNYRKFLSEIKRVMKDDGLAIISTPNEEEFAEGNHFHLHEFKLKELTDLLKKQFKYLKPYHQATWAYAQISDEEFIGKNNAHTNVEVYNYAPIKPKQYLYFYLLCSNRKIEETVKNIGGLGGHYSARELGDIFRHYQKQIEDHKVVYANEQEAHRRTQIKLAMREGENHAITQSKAYKLVKVATMPIRRARRIAAHTKALSPEHIKLITLNKRFVKRAYGDNAFRQAFTKRAQANTAVILHLYYPDMLPLFKEKLDKIAKEVKYDLYITLPQEKSESTTSIQKAFPSAAIAVVPNCGRDVLPFFQVLKEIKTKGYENILKLHSKKSPHREDGSAWRNKIIDTLLPDNKRLLKQVMATLKREDTAIIGPAGEYVSFLVNISATDHHLRRVARAALSKSDASRLMRYPNEFGFFAGTMFWARFDALSLLMEHVKPEDFEPELGQVDSTFAHALERMINIIPELQKKKMYEISDEGITSIEYATSNIPEWSEYSLGKDE